MIESRTTTNNFLTEIIDLDYRVVCVVSRDNSVLGLIEFQDGKYSDLRQFPSDVSIAGRQAIKQYLRRSCNGLQNTESE